ncbi:MAG: substrate-binding domain-containing protein [Roseibacillus sp.]
MSPIQVHSAAEQVALYLRERIRHGEIQEALPGVVRVSKMLGVNAKTVESALEILEKEGVLLNQGPRRKRLVNLQGVQKNTRKGRIRLGIVLYEPSDRQSPLIMEMEHALNEVGHVVTYGQKTLTELKMDLAGVEKLVRGEEVDAWLVAAGSREVLEWFSQQPLPTFALFGRRNQVVVPSIGPETDKAFVDGVNYLIAQGHQRIVKICRSERRKPSPGKAEREFLKTLKANQIPTGEYNLPDWVETPEGFHKLLESLFKVTPPTALIVDEVCYFVAAFQFLASKGLKVPEDVSMIVEEVDPKYHWCQPPLAHLRWDPSVVVRRIVQWASKVSQEKPDVQRSVVSAEFVKGGTVGPAPTKL